jgi:hypothetical protein
VGITKGKMPANEGAADFSMTFEKTKINFLFNSFQIKLCDVEDVDLLDRRGYLVISITLSSRGEGKIYLRKTEGIRDWFNSLKVSFMCIAAHSDYRTVSPYWVLPVYVELGQMMGTARPLLFLTK